LRGSFVASSDRKAAHMLSALRQRDQKLGCCARPTRPSSGCSSLNGPTPEQWNDHIRRHWRIENGSHYIHDIAARLRTFAYNLLRAAGCDNIKNARWRAALDLNLVLAMPGLA